MMTTHSFEVRSLGIADLELAPACFQNERDGFATIGKAAHYVQFAAEGIERPVYYFRNITAHGQRWAGITELGPGPLAVQRGIHGDDMAQGSSPTAPYHLASMFPRTFEMETPVPYSLLRFEEGVSGEVACRLVEGEGGSILDLTLEPFPLAVISHANVEQPAPYFQVNAVARGTFHGRHVVGMGGFDRTFVVREARRSDAVAERIYADTYRCTCALYSGIRADGRKECVYALITMRNGEGIGMYYLDGEDPVVTDEVRLDAVFRPLPYVDDGTLVYTDATWHIGPKTVHFNGKWGTKSFSFAPKLEKHGQSQCFGLWYEGSTPYRHVVSHAFNENTGDAYADRLRAMGFVVLDA